MWPPTTATQYGRAKGHMPRSHSNQRNRKLRVDKHREKLRQRPVPARNCGLNDKTQHRQAKITDCNIFRKAPEEGQIEGIEEWSRTILDQYRDNTEEMACTEEFPDRHLLHLLAARRSLMQKVDQTQLLSNNWGQMCISINGSMGSEKVCALLRHVINPANPKR